MIKDPELCVPDLLLVRENHFTRLVVPKSFRYAQSRRSGKPPSDEGGGKNL